MTTFMSFLAIMAPVSSFLAAGACIVLLSSSYGATKSLTIRLILWAVAFCFATVSVQNTINLIVGVPRILQAEASHFAMVVPLITLSAKLFLVGVVVATLYLHDKKEYNRQGCSVFWNDMTLSPKTYDRQDGLENTGRNFHA